MLLLSVCMLFFMGQAWAVALGKIEVTSHLGEVFFAEAPLQLDAGEKLSDLSVELATASDYQILEVFRDAALNQLSVEIVDDERGTRAVIASAEAMDTPYFNLVLKLRHGHATNFKKFPVFLDLPDQVRPVVEAIAPVAESMPAVQEKEPVSVVAPMDDAVSAAESASDQLDTAEVASSGFKPYEGWARTNRYGPMVRGDTLSTVAQRLPVDGRFTRSQIMVGLFNKNKDKFKEGNINLINAGTYLDVPTSDEVAAVQESDARRIFKEHEQRWKDLKDQPVYAAEAEAQENRYRTRVHVGQTASGVAAAPVQGDQASADKSSQENKVPQSQAAADVPAAGAAAQLRALEEENLRLKQALQESEAKAAGSKPATADAASAEEQVKRLELTVARLQRQLNQVNQQMQEVQSQDLNALTLALGGIIILLLAFAGYLLFLLRRDRPHPAVRSSSDAEIAPGAAAMLASGFDAGTGESAPDDGDSEDVDHEALMASLDSELQEDAAAGMQADDALPGNKRAVPQAGIDYLAEADVYLRYGMEDEALQQMHMAIEQRPDHLEAHSKLVELLQSRKDQEAVDAAIYAARSMLSAGDLKTFEDSLIRPQGDEIEALNADEPVAVAAEDAISDQMDDIDLDMSDGAETDDIGELVNLEDTPQDMAFESGIETDVSADLDTDHLADLSGETELDAVGDEPTVDSDVVEESSDVKKESDDGLDFVAFTQDAEPAEEKPEEVAPVAEEADGLDFSLDDMDLDAAQAEVPDSTALDNAQAYGDEGLSFESSEENIGVDGEEASEAADTDTDSETEVDFASVAKVVTPLRDPDADTVEETVLEAESGDDGLDLDDILGELSSGDAEDAPDGDLSDSDEQNESVPDADIDAASADDLGLDDILGELGSDDASPDADARKDASDIADMPEMDISGELDDLLAEWGDDSVDVALDAGPESLDVDRARSLLAEGSLDEAEAALQSALEGDRRGDALIGLAELAAKRGDESRKAELLAEAEDLVDANNQDWFDSVKNLPS
ncbi:MAG: hypothetical protein AUJ58_08855 [Zetaproteobacteria bacterium CG1_02_55_237]|nr:MAG: hypothetical protein AUJ58_08855 [Zetaproteobacteria bacterium CG1_02_55_237]